MTEPPIVMPTSQMIHAEVVSRTTFAAAQNAVPVIKRISIRNTTGRALTNLQLTLTPQPAFCRPKTWAIDRVPPGESVEVGSRQVTLDYSVLDRLNEAEHAQLVFKLFSEEELLDEQTIPIELLARDEWGGTGEMAQVLAAFVSPNHAAVSDILKEASRHLERGGHDGALNGYQTRDPRRAYMLTAAIWSAVSTWRLSYAQPPRSFECQGQKVRGPQTIKSSGLATCLDTTLLLAGAFEATGLNPVVVFTEGHAFVGVWLQDKTFPLITEDDVMEVRKAIDANELVALETTLLTQRPAVAFKQAMANAKEQLSENADKQFHMVIDIARARAAGIRPLTDREAQLQSGSSPDDFVAPAALPSPPSLDELPVEYAEALSATPSDRLERWQKKLLDLSLRNRLLNFASTRQTLKLVCADVAALEDSLAAGDKFRVISLKDENPVGNRDPQLYRQQTGKDIELEFAATAFGKGQVCSAETGKETQARLTALYRKAKSDMSEGGANTLFMAAGFLRWKKEPTDERTYLAPLLLLPIKLTRRSANSAYHLSHHEDDVVFNQTLLEFLERDFGLSIPALRGSLPEDHSGIDIKQIFSMVKQGVRDAPGFEVVEDIALSTFSFAKYLMWKDLVDRTDSLRNNRLVKHLLDSPTERFRDGTGEFPLPGVIDEIVDPAKLFTPLPADSSQLAAILAAEKGKDFVVIGPPGTGKSQTIANMIAHCLAHGRTVLFVAEKAAALDVVHRRLKAHGLADACLELHSNKSDRRSVIAQLGAAWDRATNVDEEQWVRLADNLKIKRNELNQYVEELHAPGSHGRSVFDGIGILSDKNARFKLSFAEVASHDQESFHALLQLVDRLALAHSSVKDCYALDMVEKTEWSFAWQNDLLAAARQFRDDAGALLASCERFLGHLGLQVNTEIRNKLLSGLSKLAYSIADVAEADFRFVLQGNLSSIHDSLARLEEHAGQYHSAASSLSATYDDSQIERMPLDDMDLEWRRESAKLWPLSYLGKRRVKKLLQSYSSAGQVNPEGDIPHLRSMQDALSGTQDLSARSLPGFSGVRSDVSALRDITTRAQALLSAAALVCQATGSRDSLITNLEPVLGEASGNSALAIAAKELIELNAAFHRAGNRFLALSGGSLSTPSLQTLVAAIDEIEAKASKLNDWVKWSLVKQEAEGRGLGPMVKALSSGVIDNPIDEFLVAYFTWWLPLAIDQRPKLRGFVHWEHEDRIRKYRDLIDGIQQLAANQVRRAVSHDLPARDGVPRKSELGLLRHQLGLQRPSESIRALISGMPETFTKLTPCVLMSPLSVAQYLPAEQTTFDMVIFDEASQITTWDAVGAIARGRQSIIVGDPKQLPPTNFFAKSDDEAEEQLDTHERDLLSILDEASAAGLPLHQLNWHYRSRDERLIAFSNHHYYSQRLVTFPSPSTESGAVCFHRVQGVYARGAGRTNEIEARAVTDFVLKRLEEWSSWPEKDRLSIGVITFNAPQQDLILDLLDAERAKRPHLEWFFSEDREEPVIVKNLENVQGDERDFMVFSITFGRDIAGKLSMDFGAVNREGGEKRLNVAVTRAKSEFHVFASITAEDIDTRRGKGMGVAHLKRYLDYAERGSIALASADEGSLGPAENPFEESVAAALQSRGWEVRTQIGVSGFRIDLGIVHPDRAGAFLAGIECDGATYHSSATARDRDQIREAVLRNLGWEILRIWSTDWFIHSDEVLDRIDSTLKALVEQSRVDAARELDSNDDRVDIPHGEAHSSSSTAPTGHQDFEQEITDDEDQEQYASQQILDMSSVSEEIGKEECDPSLFFEASYSARLRAIIDRVVATQGPISEAMLYRAIARLHGWQRAGRRIQERILECIGNNECIEENGNRFIWKPGSYCNQLPYRANLQRSPRDVPQAEIFGLIQGDTSLLLSADPAKSIATAMGLGRLGSDTRSYLEGCYRSYQNAHSSDSEVQ